MNPLLDQFLTEAREVLQSISEKLMQLEQRPEDVELMGGLFRLVHTLKGNSGLFDFPDMTRVLHAAEDLMDAVRSGRLPYSQQLADRLLDAMDFVGMLCDEVAHVGAIDAAHADAGVTLAKALRGLLAAGPGSDADADVDMGAAHVVAAEAAFAPAPAPGMTAQPLADIPEPVRLNAYRLAREGAALYRVDYAPDPECFFQGDDPFHTARCTPGLLWGAVVPPAAWPPLPLLDAYHCLLRFDMLASAPREELADHYRYVPEHARIVAVEPAALVVPRGAADSVPVDPDFVTYVTAQWRRGDLDALRQATVTMQELGDPASCLGSTLRWMLAVLDHVPADQAAFERLLAMLRPAPAPAAAGHPGAVPTDAALAAALAELLAAQHAILQVVPAAAVASAPDPVIAAVGRVLQRCAATLGEQATTTLDAARRLVAETGERAPLLAWLETYRSSPAQALAAAPGQVAEGNKLGRRADDGAAPTSLKVEQVKIDRLMDLIGEMVVSKNALPYLAQRAEDHFGVRELAREIKAQYAVINRIAEEMQDAIMQIRMMPVSFVFQRFPRLVRDISRKLGKEVQLVLEGEQTEADKNIVEALADPLIHIVRNSLDHGLETPEARRAAGKPAIGTLTIRASQQADQVVIEISDDGKGIDPAVIRRKACEKGIIDPAASERLDDREAVNLVFAAGFSTADVISDLSGRGVGMDVVRTAVERVNGTIALDSTVGQGTRLRIALPLSMAVTKVMIVESDAQLFGIPMDHVVETVRLPQHAIRPIKHHQTAVLRGQIVALKSLNAALGLGAHQRANQDGEMAVLVVRAGGQPVGLIVDEFRETVDVIQKPLGGVLAGLVTYSGSALMGDGSVLMVLNVKEVV